VIDWTAALTSMGGDAKLLRSVVDVLITEAPRQLDAIFQGAARNNAKDMRRAAHTLKGSLRYFGAEAAASLAEQVEQLGQSGNTTMERVDGEQLRAAISNVIRELREFQQRNSSNTL